MFCKRWNGFENAAQDMVGRMECKRTLYYSLGLAPPRCPSSTYAHYCELIILVAVTTAGNGLAQFR